MKYVEDSGIPLDAEAIHKLFALFGSDENKYIVFVEETDEKLTGLIAGAVIPWVGSKDSRGAHEMICYGKDESQLRTYFDKEAARLGIGISLISCFVPLEGSRFRRIL